MELTVCVKLSTCLRAYRTEAEFWISKQGLRQWNFESLYSVKDILYNVVFTCSLT